MSKTDKDRPSWVRANDNTLLTTEFHTCGVWRPCTLDDAGRSRYGCSRYEVLRGWFTSPPASFINHRWSAPDRNNTRMSLSRFRKEWNGTGDSDEEPPAAQHRHGAAYDWS